MAHYQFSISNATQQYVQIGATFAVTNETTQIQLSSWRPGRYELGNFAKNVKGFKIFDSNNKRLEFKKISKDRWEVDTTGVAEIKIEYSYYASQLNAGSTYLDSEQLYVNPVNCCVYVVGNEDETCEVELAIPESWKIACSMKKSARKLIASNFDELADSPFICSTQIQYNQYESNGTVFHIWFNGIVKPDWKRVIKDFKAFTDKQIEKFTEFPVPEYHFLIQILPQKAYHGVEHCKSTVIALGPSYAVFKELYKELLGVCSHELYHTWNVKTIRPIELFPYDFTKENYSRLGYLCEGVTTYMGDIFLLKSKVFSIQDYFTELLARFQVHFDNHARFNYSVADSSFDTWLDGYEVGAPNRKVSIYTEGSLLAFVADVMILKATGNKYGMDEVMKRLYFNYALNNRGVSDMDYKKELENVSGISFDDYFEHYVNGSKSYETILTEAMDYIGLSLTHKPQKSYSQARLGFKAMHDGQKLLVKAMYPGSPAELGKIMLDDNIIAVNGVVINNELDQWLEYFDDDIKTLTVIRGNRLQELILPEVNRNFYSEYGIELVKDMNNAQKKAFEAWIS